MKTKKILGTLALAALAAACSNEEFEAVNNSTALNGRVEVGQISLTVAGADTRWDIGANFNDLVPVVGDALGACLVDAPNGGSHAHDAKYDYNLTKYISTNYAFKYDGSKYVSEAKMVEGNYVFYAPYNAGHATRKPIVAKLNPVQQLDAAEDGSIDALSAIKQMSASGEVMMVGHKFISKADGKAVSAVLKPIYAYPLFTIENDYETWSASALAMVPTDLVINQVVIENGGTFTTKASLEFDGAANVTAIETTKGVVNKLRSFTYYKDNNEPEKTLNGDWISGKGNSTNYTADVLQSADDESSAIVVKAPANAWTLKAGKTTQFYAVVPASAAAVTKISIYTNAGVFEKTISRTEDQMISVGRRYPIGEYDNDGNLIVPEEGGAQKPGDAYTCKISDMVAGSGDMMVASSTDLAALITNSTSMNLSVKPLSSDVTINSAVASAFSAKGAGFTLNVKAPITIAANLTSANKIINFNKGAIVKEGTITLGAKVNFNGISEKLTVKGGKVTLKAAFTGATLKVEGGEVAVQTDVDATVTGGKLTLNDDGCTNNITLNGDNAKATLKAGDSSTNTWNDYSAATIINTNGEVTIPGYAKIGELVNQDKVVNRGVITDGVNKSNSTIDNYGTITRIENAGTIDMKDASAMVTVDCAADGTQQSGKIKNNVDATGIDKTGDTSNTIYYEFNSDVNGKLVPKCSNYDMIYLNGMTWNPEASQTIAAKIHMTDATIAIYDQETKIGIKGKVTVENTNGHSSYLKGNANAYFWAMNAVVSKPDGLTVTGITNVKWNWDGTSDIE